MFVAVEAKQKVTSWLQLPRLRDVEGSEVTVIDQDKRGSRDPANACFRTFFPKVAIDNVHSVTDIRRLREVGEEKPMPDNYDVWPSERPGWLVIRGYASDEVVFVACFYSKEEFSRVCEEVAEHERADGKHPLEKAAEKVERRKCFLDSIETQAKSAAEKSVRDLYELANKLYERGEFAEAIDLYSDAIRKASENDPDLFKSFYNRGLALYCLERYREGRNDILKVLELKPNFAEAWYILGLCKEYLCDLDGAKKAYEEALSLNPDFKDAQSRKELLKTKKPNPHSRLISKASSTRGDSNEHATILDEIKTLMKEAKLDEALELVERTLRQDPDDFQLLLHRRVIIGEITARSEPDTLCGLKDVRDMVDRLVVSRIKNWDHPLYRARIAQTSVGIILHGPPGCGKTSIIFSMAKEAGIEVIEVVLSEILNMWSGESEKRLSEIFATAKEAAGSGKFVIILVDELDSLGLARSVTVDSGESSWSRDLRNTFRRLLNDVQNIPNLAVVGLTNCLWSVDVALRRPGRMGAGIIYVSPPDTKTREEIFRLYSQETPGHETLNFEKLAQDTQWFSGDDIRSVCKDVHLQIAKRTIQTENRKTQADDKKTQAKDEKIIATMDDYERFILERVPTALGWIQSVAKAYVEGRIDDHEIDKRLMTDIKLAFPDAKREKDNKTERDEFKSHRPSYVK